MPSPNENIGARLFQIIKDQTEGMPEENDFWEYTASRAERGNRIDYREINNNLIQAFPWPIGVELRRLFSGDRKEQNKERLDQVLKVAEKSTQFLALVLLAQLWEEVKSGKARITPDFTNQFNGLDKPSFGIWAGLVRAIHSIFENDSITPFTEQFSNKYFSNKTLSKQIERLVQMRNSEMHFYKQSDADDVESALTDLLCSISFLVRFKLFAVSKIEVRKSRLSTVSFNHSLRILNSQHEDFSSDDKIFESFFESPAVMLFKESKSSNEHLNLSPLLIDTTMFLRTHRTDGIKPGVYVYNGMDRDNYLYYFTNGQEYGIMNNLPFFSEIEKEFNDLKKTLTNEKPV